MRFGDLVMRHNEIEIGELAKRDVPICLRGKHGTFERRGAHSSCVERGQHAEQFRGQKKIPVQIAGEYFAKSIAPKCWKEVASQAVEATAHKRGDGVLGCSGKQLRPINAGGGERASLGGCRVIEVRARTKQ